MDDVIVLRERPIAPEKYMIVGWEQWADAGSVSSELPAYLINKMNARKIGEIKPDSFYLFQAPGTHHYLRPTVKLEDGYRVGMTVPKNEFYFAGDERKGLVIFLGEEPHLNVDRYTDALLDVVQALGVRRVAVLGGVYGEMPYDKDREVSCVYSLRYMKEDLERYAVKFSNYEGGTTIGTYLAHRAEARNVEVVVFYAFVPAYDFSQDSPFAQGVRIDNDYRAWWELMRRLNFMFNLGLDLSDLAGHSRELVASMQAKLDELERGSPQLKVREYMARVNSAFQENPFMPLDDVWERELGDLFQDADK